MPAHRPNRLFTSFAWLSVLFCMLFLALWICGGNHDIFFLGHSHALEFYSHDGKLLFDLSTGWQNRGSPPDRHILTFEDLLTSDYSLLSGSSQGHILLGTGFGTSHHYIQKRLPPAYMFGVSSHWLQAPYWLLSTVSLLPLLLWCAGPCRRHHRARRILAQNLCPHCLYNLHAHTPGSNCPECGTPIMPPQSTV